MIILQWHETLLQMIGSKFSLINQDEISGWGRDRTVDLTIFSRTLVPTELPSREKRNRDPDGT